MFALEKRQDEQVLPHFERALKLRQSHYQSSQQPHPSIGTSYEKFSVFYSRKGQHAEALECSKKALDIYRQHYMPSHELIAKLVERIAFLEQRVNSVRRKAPLRRPSSCFSGSFKTRRINFDSVFFG